MTARPALGPTVEVVDHERTVCRTRSGDPRNPGGWPWIDEAGQDRQPADPIRQDVVKDYHQRDAVPPVPSIRHMRQSGRERSSGRSRISSVEWTASAQSRSVPSRITSTCLRMSKF